MKILLRRMMGAARLDARTASTGSAILIVVIASIAAAVGLGNTNVMEITAMTAAALLTWMVWIGLTLVIGKWIMPGAETHTRTSESSFELLVSQHLQEYSGYRSGDRKVMEPDRCHSFSSHHLNRAVCMCHDMARDAAEEQSFHSAQPTRPDENRIGFGDGCFSNNHFAWVSFNNG
jgi:hypothetical protein